MLKILGKIRLVSVTRRTAVNIRWFSDEDSSDDEKKNHKILKKNADNANKRLQELLNSMKMKSDGTVDFIKAANKRKEALEKIVEPDSSDIRVVTKKIAEKIGGDVQKTEAELLSSLLGLTEQKSSLNEIIGGLKVEKETPKVFKSRAQIVKEALSNAQHSTSAARQKRAPIQRRDKISEKVVSVNLFGSEPLNIFHKVNDTLDACQTWAELEKRELRLAVTHPPRNYFEKMALWTEQGKIWKFPIDNEQGWEEEHNTDFTEHIVLEMHLDGWCPTKGPVRHFMELVCVGLSKNNFLSAKEKKDHIMWYEGYFKEKRETLGELMTLGIQAESSSSSNSHEQVE